MIKIKKVLFISPHTDDCELGCGGTIHSLKGADVSYLALSDCKNAIPAGFKEDVLREECVKACEVLGVKKVFIESFENKNFPKLRKEIFECIEKYKERINPDTVFIPSLNDTHQDHKTVAIEAIRSFRNNFSILCYEEPWNNIKFEPGYYHKLSQADVDAKLKAISQYETQKAHKRHYLSEESLLSTMRFRGGQVKNEFAEAFEVVRIVN